MKFTFKDFLVISFAILILFIVFTTTTQKHQPNKAQKLYQNNLDSVVEIFCPKNPTSKNGQGGTGFFISEDGLIATCAHVIYRSGKENEICNTILIKIGNEKTPYYAEPYKIDREHDVAIIRILQFTDFQQEFKFAVDEKEAKKLDRKFKPLPLGKSKNLKGGETVYTIGYPEDFRRVFSDGLVCNELPSEAFISSMGTTFKEMVLSTICITHGNSGGPVFNERGEVVGIISIGSDSGFSLFQRVEYLNDLLNDKSDKVLVKDIIKEAEILSITITVDPICPVDPLEELDPTKPEEKK